MFSGRLIRVGKQACKNEHIAAGFMWYYCEEQAKGESWRVEVTEKGR